MKMRLNEEENAKNTKRSKKSSIIKASENREF